MKFFVAASYSAHVDYSTGLVEPAYKDWLEEQLSAIESAGHSVFCALRADEYRINNTDPAAAFSLDVNQIKESDAMLAIVTDSVSAGVQTEVGYALGLNKQVFFAKADQVKHQWFNMAIIKAGKAKEIQLPIKAEELTF